MNSEFELECDDDFIIISVRLYKFFMAHGKLGLDGKQLYEHLLFTARVQGSNKVKANFNYIKTGLSWGTAKIKKTKDFLHGAGLIEYVRTRDDAGHFIDHKIRIKNTWNESSLQDWIEKKGKKKVSDPAQQELKLTSGSEIDPVEESQKQTSGSKTEPVEHMGSSDPEDTKYPVVQLSTQWVSHPAVSSDNYKGSYKKENLPQTDSPPEAALPLTASIKTIDQMKRSLINQVKSRDPDSHFYLTTGECELIGICFNRFGPDWLMDVFLGYLESKMISQVNKFHGTDLPKVLRRAMEKNKTRKPKIQRMKPQDHHCPVCGKTWSASTTLSMCPQCGMELRDFDNHEEIEAHKDWWETISQNRQMAAME